MRTKKGVLTFLLLAGMILFTTQSALGGCEVANLDQLIVLDNAAGTKYSGPITVYFHEIRDAAGAVILADMYVFARFRKGSYTYAFADKMENVTHTNFINDPLIVGDFFTDNVIPYLYSCDPDSNCPEVVLKSYDLDVNHETPGTMDNPAWLADMLQFYIVDIVIAVID